MEELQGRMSHAEWVEWQAFMASEPVGGGRSDFQTAMLMTLLANIHRGKTGKKPKLADFLPDWWQDQKRPGALAAKFRAFSSGAKKETADGKRPGVVGRQADRRRSGLRKND